MYKRNGSFKLFSLVELIIVIVILGVLSVIAVITVTKRINNSKNTKVDADISSINDAFTLMYAQSQTPPLPSNHKEIYDQSGVLLWYQGDLGLVSPLNNYLKKQPKDSDGNLYKYSLSQDFETYQVMGTKLEQASNLTSKAYAANHIPRIDGNYNGFMISNSGSNYYVWQVPSLFLFTGNKISESADIYFYEDMQSGEKKENLKRVAVSGLFDNDSSNDCENLDKLMLTYSSQLQSRSDSLRVLKTAALVKNIKNTCNVDSEGGYLDLSYLSTMDFTKKENQDFVKNILYGPSSLYTKDWIGTGCVMSGINISILTGGGVTNGANLNAANTVYVLKDKNTSYDFSSTINLNTCSSIVGLATIKSTSNFTTNGLIKLSGKNIIDGIVIDNNGINDIGINIDTINNALINRISVQNSKTKGINFNGAGNVTLLNSQIKDSLGNSINITNTSNLKFNTISLIGGVIGISTFNLSQSSFASLIVQNTSNSPLKLDSSMGNNFLNSDFMTGGADGILLVNGSTENTFDGGKTMHNAQRGINLSGVCGNTIKNYTSSFNGIQVTNGIKSSGCNVLENIKTDSGLDASGICGYGSGSNFLSGGAISDSLKCQLGTPSIIAESTTGFSWSCKNGNSLPISCKANKIIIDQTQTLPQLGVGSQFACAIHTGGTLWCWGFNYYGQLGNGSLEPSKIPVIPAGMTNVKQVSIFSAGGYVCALKKDGTVWCWGQNNYGQLGIGSTTNVSTPTQVSGLTNIKKLSTSEAHTCALKEDNSLTCWGVNSYYTLGDGTNLVKTSPVTSFASIAGSVKDVQLMSHATLIQKLDGTLWAIGHNVDGRIGDGTFVNKTTLTQIFSSPIIDFKTGVTHSCLIKNDNTLWCWGNGAQGKLGLGNVTNRNVITQVTSITSATKLYVGNTHTCVSISDGTFKCWGLNNNGQLGNGMTEDSFTPVNFTSSAPNNLVLGNSTTFVIKTDGTILGIGSNNYGELGYGKSFYYLTPYDLNNMISTRYKSLYNSLSFYTDGDGQVYGRGGNSYGQVGDGTYLFRWEFQKINGITNVIDYRFGNGSTYAIKSDNTLRGWGNDSAGQIGQGTVYTTGYTSPQFITGDVISVSANNSGSCIIRSNKTVYCNGQNNVGQVGDGTTTPVAPYAKSKHSQVTGLTNVVKLAGTTHCSYAVKSDGTLWSWGRNAVGQLGDGTKVDKKNIVNILSNVADITAHALGNSACALKNDSTVWCWGQNSFGQVGNGSLVDVVSPVKVFENATKISCVQYACYAIKNDGTVWGWGYNGFGQLGDGTTIGRPSPVQVLGVSNVLDIIPLQNILIIKKNDSTYRGIGLLIERVTRSP